MLLEKPFINPDPPPPLRQIPTRPPRMNVFATWNSQPAKGCRCFLYPSQDNASLSAPLEYKTSFGEGEKSLCSERNSPRRWAELLVNKEIALGVFPSPPRTGKDLPYEVLQALFTRVPSQDRTGHGGWK